MQLSKRLLTVVNMLEENNIICDVGCDHGYVPIYLIQSKKCQGVIAVDVRHGPLERAKEHIKAYGLERYIEVKLSDGLADITIGEVNAMVCAGMGGKLMQKILLESYEKVCHLSEIILQPQSEIMQLREFLLQYNFIIVDEEMVYEEGKFYPIIKCVSKLAIKTKGLIYDQDKMNPQIWSKEKLKYGAILLEKKHPILCQYLQEEIKKIKKIKSDLLVKEQKEHIKDRIKEIELELAELNEILVYMENIDGM